MTDTSQMLASAGPASAADYKNLAATIEALRDCEQASNTCAMAMVKAGGMVEEVHRALDCADLCESTERVLSRAQGADTSFVTAVLHVCMLACQASAAACGAHADHHEHCQMHSESARRCADAISVLLESVQG